MTGGGRGGENRKKEKKKRGSLLTTHTTVLKAAVKFHLCQMVPWVSTCDYLLQVMVRNLTVDKMETPALSDAVYFFKLDAAASKQEGKVITFFPACEIPRSLWANRGRKQNGGPLSWPNRDPPPPAPCLFISTKHFYLAHQLTERLSGRLAEN